MNEENKVPDTVKDIDTSKLEKFDIHEYKPLEAEPARPSKKEVERIFNEGSYAFLKNNKNIHDCPYNEQEEYDKYMAWGTGFTQSAHHFIEDFANECVRDMIKKCKEEGENGEPTPLQIMETQEMFIREVK